MADVMLIDEVDRRRCLVGLLCFAWWCGDRGVNQERLELLDTAERVADAFGLTGEFPALASAVFRIVEDGAS